MGAKIRRNRQLSHIGERLVPTREDRPRSETRAHVQPRRLLMPRACWKVRKPILDWRLTNAFSKKFENHCHAVASLLRLIQILPCPSNAADYPLRCSQDLQITFGVWENWWDYWETQESKAAVEDGSD